MNRCGNCGTDSKDVRRYLFSLSCSHEAIIDDGEHIEDTHVYLCERCCMRAADSLRRLTDQYREEIRNGDRVRG